jgi:hypothetical protein
MKRKQQKPAELEAELTRLNELVRQRRKTLTRLAQCPNTDCECRVVWREHTEKSLAGQVGKVSRHVKAKTQAKAKAPKTRSRRTAR